MVPINELDAIQTSAIEEIVDDLGTDHLVTGFAGSGKTIVLTHVLERLALSPKHRTICFATYTHALKDLVESGLSPATLEAVDIQTFDALRRVRERYDVMIADELQDVSSRYFDAFRNSYRTLIAAADFDQRIFRQAAPTEKIESLLRRAETHELQEIHRVNENIFQVATTVLDARIPDDATVRSDGEKTRMFAASSRREEFTTMYDEAVRVAAKEHPSAILFPTRKLLANFIGELASEHSWGEPPELENPEDHRDKFGPINDFLKRARTPLQVFGSGSGEMKASDRRPIVYLMTYHSAKGLDFPYVFLLNLTEETSLQPMKHASDEEERRMFFVAATRAKRRLYLSYHGDPHRFLYELNADLITWYKKPRRTY